MDTRMLRKLHGKVAPIIFLPLFVAALTGLSYRIARSWFGASDEIGEFLMYIHQGTFLGEDLRIFYMLLNVLGIIAVLRTGISMTALCRRKWIQD